MGYEQRPFAEVGRHLHEHQRLAVGREGGMRFVITRADNALGKNARLSLRARMQRETEKQAVKENELV